MRLEDSPWKRFVARALVLSVMIFGAVRLAVADPGVAGGAARTPPLFAVSITRATPPSRWVTWFQAQELCHASGKRLPTRDEWLSAARGTAETGCHIATTNAGPRNTADGASCVSEWGARDMVGNLWELTDEWYAGLSGSGTDGRSDWPSDYGGDGTWNITPSVFNMPGSTRSFAIPAVAERGGAWPSGTTAGRFALLLVDGPSNWTGGVGFRCVIPR